MFYASRKCCCCSELFYNYDTLLDYLWEKIEDLILKTLISVEAKIVAALGLYATTMYPGEIVLVVDIFSAVAYARYLCILFDRCLL